MINHHIYYSSRLGDSTFTSLIVLSHSTADDKEKRRGGEERGGENHSFINARIKADENKILTSTSIELGSSNCEFIDRRKNAGRMRKFIVMRVRPVHSIKGTS